VRNTAVRLGAVVELRRRLLSATVHELDDNRHRRDPHLLAQLRSGSSTAGRRRRRVMAATVLGLGFRWRHKSTGWRLELGLGILGVRRGLNSPGGRPRRAGQGNRACRRRTRAVAPRTQPSPARGRLRGGDDRRAPPVSCCCAGERGSGLATAFWADWATRLLGCYARKAGPLRAAAWAGPRSAVAAGLEGKNQGG
jgi:hypothetical protein